MANCCPTKKSLRTLRALMPRSQSGGTKCIEREIPKYGYYPYGNNQKALLQGRPKYRNDPNKPKGIHDYYNISWDPHVYRGQTFKTFQTVELERKRAIDKDRKRKFRKPPPRKLGGIEIPQTPPLAEGHERNVVATERFLEEFSVPVEEKDAETQTDIIDELPPSIVYVPIKSGFDVGTEIYPDEMFHFDEEVKPIVETLAWKVLEQSLLEFAEEEELRQLTVQQNQYEERRRLELVRMKRLAEREQQMYFERAAIMEMLKKQMTEERESEERVGAFLFSCSYLKELIPVCLENLAEDGFLHNKDITEITEKFMPWLDNEVKREFGQKLMSRAIADDIIGHVAVNREAELAAGKWVQNEPIPNYYDLLPEYEEE